jgi:uncharacterized protein (DUF1800 family)
LVWADPELTERWNEPVPLLILRSQAATAETVTLEFSGTATLGVDYRASLRGAISFPVGTNEVVVWVTPLSDATTEPTETILASLREAPVSATATLGNRTDPLTRTEAVRFLTQAGFGGDEPTVQEVMRLGVGAWINNQFTRPVHRLQPIIQRMRNSGQSIFHPAPKVALWEQVMRPLNPAGPSSELPDPLRHRVAFSLMQIFVISQNTDTLSLNSEGVTHYYDRLLTHSFGNFRNILKEVCLHPCMGFYLSHVGNRKADPLANRFPDENFARELMQLFSIGLWELNQDGTRVLVDGKPVPTYTNATIREYARIFTGFQYGGPSNQSFDWAGEHFLAPMKLWDSQHDLEPKRLIDGTMTPQRQASNPDTGAAAMADVDMAIDSLFNHPNVGPFIGKLLIQRLTTSNPSPAYVSRVAGKFNNNGRGVRGDMRAVLRQILLDPEVRLYNKTLGKKREPYLAIFNLAKAFDARPQSGNYEGATYLYDFLLQEPFQSPSVFNFYLPSYRPPGEMTTSDLTGPEFQIMTAVTAHGALNIGYKMIHEYLAHWGSDGPDQIKPKFDEYLPIAGDPEALVFALCRRMLDRKMRPATSKIIREAVAKMPSSGGSWQLDRVKLAAYLIYTSPDFHIQK